MTGDDRFLLRLFDEWCDEDDDDEDEEDDLDEDRWWRRRGIGERLKLNEDKKKKK